jgi:hypothetical protein
VLPATTIIKTKRTMNPKIQQVQFELCSLLFVKNDKDDKKTDNIIYPLMDLPSMRT